jgi:anti-anti-sigma factor
LPDPFLGTDQNFPEIYPVEVNCSASLGKLAAVESFLDCSCMYLITKLFMNTAIQVVKPSKMLDSTQAYQIRQQVNQMLESGSPFVLIDLENVMFMDSFGLGALVLVYKSLRSVGGKLFLCSVAPQVKMLFELTGTDQIFQVFSSQQEFHTALSCTPNSLVIPS